MVFDLFKISRRETSYIFKLWIVCRYCGCLCRSGCCCCCLCCRDCSCCRFWIVWIQITLTVMFNFDACIFKCGPLAFVFTERRELYNLLVQVAQITFHNCQLHPIRRHLTGQLNLDLARKDKLAQSEPNQMEHGTHLANLSILLHCRNQRR